MRQISARYVSTAVSLGLVLALATAPSSAAFAFGGGHFGGGGGHFSGGGGHFGGGGANFGGGHFGGAHFGGGHFGGGAHFGGFHGGHFGGAHFGGFHAGHFGGMRMGGMHVGHRFGGMHFGGARFGHIGHMHLGHANFGHTNFGHAHLGHAFGGTRFGAGHVGGHFGHALVGGAVGAGAARHFTGFHGNQAIATHGFNRNGFGQTVGWNSWARNHWGLGWNAWGSGFGYWAGPVFWPFFYGDALSFALWPDDFYDPFFAYGPDYLLAGIFWPGPYYDYYDYAYGPLFDIYGAPPPEARNYYGYYHHHRRHHHRHAVVQSATNDAATCGGLAPGVDSVPVDRIRRAIKPTDQQNDILNQLQQASSKADGILQASCPKAPPLTPVGRLEAIATRLQAMIQAIDLIRPPLVKLDQSLDDKQREAFDKLGRSSRHARGPQQDLAALCKQETASFTALPITRIQDQVQPTVEQKLAFDTLKSASQTAAQKLDASCPSEMPKTVTERFDALRKRLTALNDAATSLKPALAQFYAVLSDEQKARFNIIGAASPQDQGKSKG